MDYPKTHHKKRVLVSWSGGKDSAWALHRLRQDPHYEVVALLTSVNSHFERVAVHGVRRALLQAQAAAAGLPLWTAELPFPCSNAQYEESMAPFFTRAVSEGIAAIAFGDLFLQDIRTYREKQLSGTGLEIIFPLWQLPTRPLADEMISAGLRARLACIDPRHLAGSFAGREFDRALLRDLPPSVDPCGENGEFHTFVYAGPMFSAAIPVENGEVVQRDSYIYCDLLPVSAVMSST